MTEKPSEVELKNLLIKVFLKKDEIDKKRQALKIKSRPLKKEKKHQQRVVDELQDMLRYLDCEKQNGGHDFRFLQMEGAPSGHNCSRCGMNREFFENFSIMSYAKSRGINLIIE
jgi:hypothetical protein